MSDDGYSRIFVTSKWRFLQSEASSWFISNRIYHVTFFGGLACYLWFLLFPTNHFLPYSKNFGGFIALWSLFVIVKRQMLYNGYYAGYEQGFIDAATRNLDYWGSRDDSHLYELRIQQALNEIETNEVDIPEKNKAERADEIKKGYVNFWGAKVLALEQNPVIVMTSKEQS